MERGKDGRSRRGKEEGEEGRQNEVEERRLDDIIIYDRKRYAIELHFLCKELPPH